MGEPFDMRQVGTYDPEGPPPETVGILTHVQGGPVVEDPRDTGYVGATKQSNNTGELTALFYALRRAYQRNRDAPAEDIYTDSLYARNVTLGVWRGKRRKHAKMIRNLRTLWKQVQMKRGRDTVRILHVRSHIGVPGNELADRAADRAMRNANEVVNARNAIPPRQPVLLTIDLEWARAQMRAIIGSSRLRPPLQPPHQPPRSTHHALHPRTGDG